MALIPLVMNNGTINKYENKEKTSYLLETLTGKNHGQRRKFHYESKRNYILRFIGNKP